MKNLVLMVLVAVTFMLSGCSSMVGFATEYLAEMRDTTRYETVRESVDGMCSEENYRMLSNLYGKTLIDRLRRDVCNPDTRKIDPGL